MPEKPQHQSPVGPLANPTIAEHVIAHLPLAVITFNYNFDIIAANPAAEEMFGPCQNILEIIQSCSQNGKETDWQTLLPPILDQGKAKIYDEIRYTDAKRARILRLICTPLEQQPQNDTARGALVFQDITATFIMTNGGPVYATTTIGLYIYKESFQNFEMGQAAAVRVAWLFFLAFLGTLYVRLLSKAVKE